MQNENSSDLKNQDYSAANSLNSNLTAIPKGAASVDEAAANPDLIASEIEFGSMNEEDARESGYIAKNGKAVSKARKSKKGSPTGAYTDIGAGRSSAVVRREFSPDMQKQMSRSTHGERSQSQIPWAPVLLFLAGSFLLLKFWTKPNKITSDIP